MKIVIYGLSVTSSWGNGHATTYRSLLRALARRGHEIVFVEKDVEWYRNNRDLPHPEFCTVQLYEDWTANHAELLALSASADAIVVGSYFPDAIVATQELRDKSYGPLFFYDIDTPITLAALRQKGHSEYLQASMVPVYSAYLSFTGGPVLQELQHDYGAREALPLYCSVDEELYLPTATDPAFECELSYLGTYASDRQPKLMRLLNETASDLHDRHFLVAGPQYPEDLKWHKNVTRIDHVPPARHPAFYSSARFTLNLTRKDMVAAGYSPSVRLFEAAACGAAIISDVWAGIETFLLPGTEIMMAEETADVVKLLCDMPDSDRRELGMQARQRILSAHTSKHRAIQFEEIVAAIQ